MNQNSLHDKVDIIIPHYNSSKQIRKCLYSIASQVNEEDIYVYIVDDCSSKEHLDSLKEFISFHSPVSHCTLIELEENHGQGYARQVGMEKSSSPFIMFIDADDIFISSLSVWKGVQEVKGRKWVRTDMMNNPLLDEKLKCIKRDEMETEPMRYNWMRDKEGNLCILSHQMNDMYEDSHEYWASGGG